MSLEETLDATKTYLFGLSLVSRSTTVSEGDLDRSLLLNQI